jgi:hypothetical protein
MDRELIPCGDHRFVIVRRLPEENTNECRNAGRLALFASPSLSVMVPDRTPGRRNKCDSPLRISAMDFPGNGPVVDPAIKAYVPVLNRKNVSSNCSSNSVAHCSAKLLTSTLVLNHRRTHSLLVGDASGLSLKKRNGTITG